MIRAHSFRCNGHGTAIEGLCLVVLSLSYSQNGDVLSGVSVHECESNENTLENIEKDALDVTCFSRRCARLFSLMEQSG